MTIAFAAAFGQARDVALTLLTPPTICVCRADQRAAAAVKLGYSERVFDRINSRDGNEKYKTTFNPPSRKAAAMRRRAGGATGRNAELAPPQQANAGVDAASPLLDSTAGGTGDHRAEHAAPRAADSAPRAAQRRPDLPAAALDRHSPPPAGFTLCSHSAAQQPQHAAARAEDLMADRRARPAAAPQAAAAAAGWPGSPGMHGGVHSMAQQGTARAGSVGAFGDGLGWPSHDHDMAELEALMSEPRGLPAAPFEQAWEQRVRPQLQDAFQMYAGDAGAVEEIEAVAGSPSAHSGGGGWLDLPMHSFALPDTFAPDMDVVGPDAQLQEPAPAGSHTSHPPGFTAAPPSPTAAAPPARDAFALDGVPEHSGRRGAARPAVYVPHLQRPECVPVPTAELLSRGTAAAPRTAPRQAPPAAAGPPRHVATAGGDRGQQVDFSLDAPASAFGGAGFMSDFLPMFDDMHPIGVRRAHASSLILPSPTLCPWLTRTIGMHVATRHKSWVEARRVSRFSCAPSRPPLVHCS